MKNLGKKITVLAFFLLIVNIKAQNLVPNGDFENVTINPVLKTNANLPGCSNNLQPFDPSKYPVSWLQANNGSPDVFGDGFWNSSTVPTCINTVFSTLNPPGPPVCATDNFIGVQNPKSGNRFMGIVTTGKVGYISPITGDSTFREYLLTELTTPLVIGQCYKLKFYASRADNSKYATPLQAALTSYNPAEVGNTCSIGPISSINFGRLLSTLNTNSFLETPTIIDDVNWTLCEFNFKAKGGEKFLTIGFFEDQYSSKIVLNQNGNVITTTWNPTDIYLDEEEAYYYIDDVSLTPTGSPNFIPTLVLDNPFINTPTTWSNQNILINGDITLNANLTIGQNTKIEFVSYQSDVIVNAGKILSISNSTLEAGCSFMWRGITVAPGGTIQTTNSVINDAILAVNISGWNSGFNFNTTKFNRNENDIKLNSVVGTVASQFVGCEFNHTANLKDPARGINGKGITGIEIITSSLFSGFNVNVSGTSTLKNTFLGGRNGIKSEGSKIRVAYCDFQNIADYGITSVTNVSTIKRDAVINNNSFSNVRRSIDLFNNTNCTIFSNTFNNPNNEHGVALHNNNDCVISVLNNTFVSQNWTAILTYDNASVSQIPQLNTLSFPTSGVYSHLNISSNSINSVPWGAGIAVLETSLGSNIKYHNLTIKFNNIRNTYEGIVLSNVRGYGDQSTSVNASDLTSSDVYNNSITMVTTPQTPNARGVKAENCPGLRYMRNMLRCSNSGDYQNNGFFVQNSPGSLIYDNYIRAGYGISVSLDMLNSNMYCNVLDLCVVGYQLGYCTLRTVGQTHGTLLSPRNSYFTNTAPWGSDFHLYNSDRGLNRWVYSAQSFPGVSYTGNTGTGAFFVQSTSDNTCGTPIQDTGHYRMSNSEEQFGEAAYLVNNIKENDSNMQLLATILTSYHTEGALKAEQQEALKNLTEKSNIENNDASIYSARNLAMITGMKYTTKYDMTLGVSDKQKLNEVKVSPNPGNGKFLVESNEPFSIIELYSLDGLMIKSAYDIPGKTAVIDLTGQTSGVYLLKITLESGNKASKKIILAH